MFRAYRAWAGVPLTCVVAVVWITSALNAAAPAAPAESAEVQAKKAQELFKELYGADHDKAVKAPAVEKVKFAKKLAEAAELAAGNPALAKLLHQRAVEFASADKSGYALALEQLRAIPADKDDRPARLEQTAVLLEKIVRAEKPPTRAERAQEMVEVWRELAREQAERGEFDAAVKALEKARYAVRVFLAGSKDILAEIDRDGESATAKQKAHAKLEAARQTLKGKPEDAAANTIVGLSLLAGGDAAGAAPHLSKAADPAIKKLGEVAAKPEPGDLDLADALKAAGQSPAAKDWQPALYAAAAKHYQALLEKEPEHPQAVRIKLILNQLGPAAPDKPVVGTTTPKPVPVSSIPGKPLKGVRAFTIGSQYTDIIRLRGVADLAKARGQEFVVGRQTLSALSWMWSHPTDGGAEEPFGKWQDALAKHEWDVLVLQPNERMLEGDDECDLPVCKRFAEFALKKSPNLQVAVLSCWPQREEKGGAVEKIDYPTRWGATFNGGWGGRTYETHDYYEKLAAALRKALPQLKKPVIVVPVGDVLLELDRRMKAGKVPGLKDADQLYRDKQQLSDVGAYAAGCTVYATLLRSSPAGLPADVYNVTDAKVARAVQDAVWDVVSRHPSAGVGK